MHISTPRAENGPSAPVIRPAPVHVPMCRAIDARLRTVHRPRMTQLTPADIAAAAARIAGHIRHTPVLQVEPGALGLPYAVTLKLEHTQVTGSFKVRGAFNNLLSRDVPDAGVVAASGGNHGAAVAYAATKLGHKSVVFVPRAIAKEEKLRRMRDFGAEVILTEGSVADCMAEYAAHAEATGALSVHPYDTAPTLAGQGTVALEIEAQTDGFDTIMVATGGGGLIGGIAAWLGDRVRVVSIETEGTNTLARSLREGPDIDVAAAVFPQARLADRDWAPCPTPSSKKGSQTQLCCPTRPYSTPRKSCGMAPGWSVNRARRPHWRR